MPGLAGIGLSCSAISAHNYSEALADDAVREGRQRWAYLAHVAGDEAAHVGEGYGCYGSGVV